MRFLRPFTVSAIVLGMASVSHADVYTDGHLTVDWTRTGDQYAGTFTLDGKAFPAQGTTPHIDGRPTPNDVRGTFQANAASFDFSATLVGDTLTVTSGVKTYTLGRQATNPLDTAPGTAFVSGVNGSNDAPAGYQVVTRADGGQALATTKNAGVVRDALLAAVPDLTAMLDGPAKIGGAVEDQKDHKSGMVVFTGTQKGAPVRGVIHCNLIDADHARVTIVICRPDASAETWKQLVPQSGGDAAVLTAANAIKTTPYRFPDGSGTLGLPDGWTTKAASILDPFQVDGPNDAHVYVNIGLMFWTPDNPSVLMDQQIRERGRRLGMPPMPPMEVLVAPFAAPIDSFQTIIPALNELFARHNGPQIRIDQVTGRQPTNTSTPGGRAELADYLWTKSDHGTVTHYRNISRMESIPTQYHFWSISTIGLEAPADQFEAAQPSMVAILNSGKRDEAAITRILEQRNAIALQNAKDAGERQRIQFENGQAAHRAQMASFDAQNKTWAANENLKDRANDNFVEHIRGTRDVLDTRTGQQTSVDLNDAAGVAASLNADAHDPDRFKPIPLADQNHPLPGN